CPSKSEGVTRMKQLFVTSFLPQKNAPQAGHRLAFDYLTQLSAQNDVDVVIISRLPVRQNDIEFRASVGQVYVKYVNTLDLIPSFLADPLHFAQRFSYAVDLKRRFGDSIELVLGVHDVQIQVVLRIQSLEGRFFAKQTFEFEQRVMKLADKVRVLSAKDAQLIQALYPGVASLDVVPIPLPAFVKGIRRSKDTVQKGNILFWGAMQRRENEEALLNFV